MTPRTTTLTLSSTFPRPAVIMLALFAAASGCSGTADRWTGSVDAVFRYRVAEHATFINEVRTGSTSERAGLKAGDVLLAVDGVDITKATYEAVRAALRGPVGTVTKLTVKRGDAIIEVAVERAPLEKDKK